MSAKTGLQSFGICLSLTIGGGSINSSTRYEGLETSIPSNRGQGPGIGAVAVKVARPCPGAQQAYYSPSLGGWPLALHPEFHQLQYRQNQMLFTSTTYLRPGILLIASDVSTQTCRSQMEARSLSQENRLIVMWQAEDQLIEKQISC